MASIATFLSKIPSSLPSSSERDRSPFSSTFPFISTKKRPSPSLRQFPLSPRATAKTSGDRKPSAGSVERVHRVHSIAEFEAALRSAKNKLVVVEYAASQSPNSRRIYPCMVELSRTCDDVDFLLVMGDESDETRELCRREGIDKVPHFSFYKGMEKLHEEEDIGPDQLVGDVLYYGDKHAGVVQLHCREDVEALIDEHRGADGKLVVLDVGLKHCARALREGLPDGDQALQVDGGRRGVREDERRRERQLHGVLEGYGRGGGANLLVSKGWEDMREVRWVREGGAYRGDP